MFGNWTLSTGGPILYYLFDITNLGGWCPIRWYLWDGSLWFPQPTSAKKVKQPQTLWRKKITLVHLKDPSFSLTALEISVNRTVLDAGPTRPGKRLHKTMGKPWENHVKMVIYMEHHHFSWVNRLFLWPFSIAMIDITRGSFNLDIHPIL